MPVTNDPFLIRTKAYCDLLGRRCDVALGIDQDPSIPHYPYAGDSSLREWRWIERR